jgi:hypothetical protein
MLADELETVAAVRDYATDPRRFKFHDRVPTGRHDIDFMSPTRKDKNDRASLKQATDLVNWQIDLRLAQVRDKSSHNFNDVASAARRLPIY